MPKTVVPVRFVPDDGTGYLMDIGTEIAANGRFVLPPDIPQTEISTILTNIGAQPLSAIGDPIPCSDASNADLRKLEFIRSNGNSMSVPVSSRANLLNAATVIRGVLNSAGSDVVCIKLMGEYFPDLADELGLNYGNDFAVSHVPTTGGKQYYHAGNISYETDAATGIAGSSVVFQPVKAISDLETAPSSQLTAAWTGCVGPFENALAYQSDLARVYPMFAVSVVQVNDVPTDINPVDLLPVTDNSNLIDISNPCAVYGLTPRKLALWLSDGAQFLLTYPQPFSNQLAVYLTASVQITAWEFVGERLKYGRLRKLLDNALP